MSDLIVIGSFAKNSRESVRVSLDTYKGVRLVDARVCVELTKTSGILTPTGKGLSLGVDKLPRLIEELAAAATKARALGWIGDDQ